MRASPKNPFDWKFLNVGSVIVYSFVRNVPKIQECWLAPVSLRGLTIKGVYEVSYSCYGQIIERVCIFKLYLYKSVSNVNAKRDFIRFVSFYFRVRKLTFFGVMRDINTLVPLLVLRNGLGRTMNTHVLHTIIVYMQSS